MVLTYFIQAESPNTCGFKNWLQICAWWVVFNSGGILQPSRVVVGGLFKIPEDHVAPHPPGGHSKGTASAFESSSGWEWLIYGLVESESYMKHLAVWCWGSRSLYQEKKKTQRLKNRDQQANYDGASTSVSLHRDHRCPGGDVTGSRHTFEKR